MFETPDVWKKLRNLSLARTNRRTRTPEDHILPLLPASLAYLSLNAAVFDVSSLVDLKSSPVQIAFPEYVGESIGLMKKLDVLESLRVLNDPPFSHLKKLEVPRRWMVEPIKMRMVKKGVALAALEKDRVNDGANRSRAVLTLASEE